MRLTTFWLTARPARIRQSRECGANLVEYALLVAFIAIVCIGAVTFLGDSLPDRFNEPASVLSNTAD